MNVRICFEVEDFVIDESGNPAPAGMCIAFKANDDAKLPDYQALAKAVRELAGQPDNIVFITPEEYDRKYGENANT